MYVDYIFNFIIQAIEKNKDHLTTDYIDNYLELRDSGNFDEKWSSTYDYFNSTNNKTEEFSFDEKKLRERIFKKTVQLTQNYELAEYISDDGGLIYANLNFKSENSFVNYILECYENHILPSTTK